MKILLDTHAFLWFIMASPRLSQAARSCIEDPLTERFLSIASLWEMAVKVSIGKLTLAQPFEQIIPEQVQLNGIQLLNISIEHLTRSIALPFHHRDPFDRLIAAQALVEPMNLVTVDPSFDLYGVTRVW